MLAECDLANSQFGDERRMSRQHAQIAVLARYLDFLGSGVNHLFFRRDDLELESICHQFAVVSCQSNPLTDRWPLTTLTLLPSSSPRLRALPRWALSCRTPAQECRRTCLRRSP